MKVTCDYCGKPAHFTDSAIVYGQSYGMIYYCPQCRAWVGVHKGTDKPLGRLADAELREQRRMAHGVFDRIWKRRCMTRGKAYAWLAQQMGLTSEAAHIGMFNVAQCKQVIELCAEVSNLESSISDFDSRKATTLAVGKSSSISAPQAPAGGRRSGLTSDI